MSQPAVSVDRGEIPAAVQDVLLDEATILRRVGELARQISADYQGRELVVVGVLTGAFMFASDLVRRLSLPVSIDFIAISRYDPRPETGQVSIIKDLSEDIHGKEVLLIEDIVDTGLSLNYLVEILSARGPASIAICSLLDRSDLRLADIPLNYVGFNVTHEFLIGYGLDYRESYRNLPFVATMKL